MNKLDSLKSKLNETKAEMEKLEEEIKNLEENNGKWVPEEGERYYFVKDNLMGASEYINNSYYDKEFIKYNKVFKTAEEAQNYADYLKALKEASYEFTNEEWNDANIYKYYIYYDYRYEQLGILTTALYRAQKGIYFKTKEEMRVFINKYKKQILKYEFGIEEE